MNDKLKLAVIALLTALLEDLNASPAATQTSAAPAAPTPKGKKAAPAPAPEPEAEEEPAAEEEVAEEEVAEEPEAPTLESLRELASTLLTAGRKPEVVKVLAKFKVAALKDLNAKHYPAVHAALTTLAESE
jgi:hypothetical protein